MCFYGLDGEVLLFLLFFSFSLYAYTFLPWHIAVLELVSQTPLFKILHSSNIIYITIHWHLIISTHNGMIIYAASSVYFANPR